MAQSPRDSFASFREPGAAFLQTSSPTFGLADAEDIERSFVASARRLRTQLLHLVDSRASGTLSVRGFVDSARQAIRTAYFRAYALGAISIFPFYTLTERDVRLLDDELLEEVGFLRGFATDLDSGGLDVEAVRRAGLYLLALRGVFERGRTEAMPAGPYAWALGPTEHCRECLKVAEAGPYQRERYSGLGLPALPGAPGDGSVCLGLTNCGCTIKLANGTQLPNPDLPTIIRSRLVEVVYGSSSVASGTAVE